MTTAHFVKNEEIYDQFESGDDVFAFIYFNHFLTPIYELQKRGFPVEISNKKLDINPIIIKAPSESFINGSSELTYLLPNLSNSVLYCYNGCFNIGFLNVLTKMPLKITINCEYKPDYYYNCVLRIRVDKEKTKVYEEYKNMWSDEFARDFGFDEMKC